MSQTVHGSAVCPGQQTMMHGGDHNTVMLRVAAMVYWLDAAPSLEIFYLRNRPLTLNPRAIDMLEQDIVALLQTNDQTMRAQRAIYISYSGIEMTNDDIAAADWHVIHGAPTTA